MAHILIHTNNEGRLYSKKFIWNILNILYLNNLINWIKAAEEQAQQLHKHYYN